MVRITSIVAVFSIALFIGFYLLSEEVFSCLLEECFSADLAKPLPNSFWEYVPKWRLPFAMSTLPWFYLLLVTKLGKSIMSIFFFFTSVVTGVILKMYTVSHKEIALEEQLFNGEINFGIWIFMAAILSLLILFIVKTIIASNRTNLR